MKSLKGSIFMLLVSVGGLGYGQNFQDDAIIITHQGDSIHGLIKNRDWKKNPRRIQFTTSNDSEVLNYIPIDIDGFTLKSGTVRYKSSVLRVDKSSLRDADVINSVNQKRIVVDSVFLRVIVSGRMTLYQLIDENAKEHFIVEKDNKLVPLQLVKIRIVGSTLTVATGELYKDELKKLMVDYPEISGKIDRSRYSYQAMKSLVEEYNEHFSDIDYVVVTEKAKVEISVLAGANYSNLELSGSPLNYEFGDYDPDVSPYVGVSVLVVLPKNHRSWAFGAELLFRNYSIEDKFTASQLKLVNTLRYRIPKKLLNHRLYFGAGITNAFALDYKVTPNTKTYPLSTDYRNHEQGYVLEVGLGGKLGYFFRYESANGFSTYPATIAKFRNFYAGLSYTFGRLAE